ncbi:Na+/glutamate symporter [Agromyces cerinus]|uniref:Na+/glutamate symporter n=1 Tax=Agromyces hippuratus TaxID=286438 RepID=A0A852WQT1_9MICO|nr:MULTISPECIES: hypothetical protein [Agromyces]MBM7830581.1 Na+/glutamate symporter [Agromyces cerinus]NYG19908.1 Na+/glutamate symporter [Agromyces hippuratus]
MSDLPPDMDASGWLTLGIVAVALVAGGFIASWLKKRRSRTSSSTSTQTDAEVARQHAIDEAERLTRNPRERY